jgi:lipoprotein-anchoring transpeptidase ErfK/SrfK
MARVRFTLPASVACAAVVLTAAPAYAAADPTTVTALAAKPADKQVTLTWVNPADADFAGVTVVEKQGATPPADPADGEQSIPTTAQRLTVTGLVNGTTYSFAVFTRNTAGAVSQPAVVQADPVPALFTTLTIAATPATVTYGSHPVLRATLRRSDTGAAVAGETVDVYRQPYGASGYSHVYRLTTNAYGIAAVVASPGVYTRWYAAHPGNPSFAASSSSPVGTTVRAKVSVTRSPAAVQQNVASAITATVTPNHAGDKVLLQRWYGNAWHFAGAAYLSTWSVATFRVATSEIGTRTYRVAKSSDSDHATGTSISFGITTVRRTLRSGMTGSDVLAVERRLAALHYDVGALNSAFDYDTLHATAAFQKVNRLPVTGEVDPRTYDRLWRSTMAPKLLHPQSGTWVEVDLTKQTLYLAKDGAVQRILDISSGSGKFFTVDGETQQAVTPMGSFRIYHKIDGQRISRLGSLWRPAYFAAGGYAIHGNSSVPFHPASHGCVRITNSAMNRLFALLQVGMRVYVYRT